MNLISAILFTLVILILLYLVTKIQHFKSIHSLSNRRFQNYEVNDGLSPSTKLNCYSYNNDMHFMCFCQRNGQHLFGIFFPYFYEYIRYTFPNMNIHDKIA